MDHLPDAIRPGLLSAQHHLLTEIFQDRTVFCVQTTLRMEEELLRKAKAVAVEEGETLTAFIEGAIRQRLEARNNAQTAPRPPIPLASGAGGLLPGIDIDDTSSLVDVMEEK